MKHIFILCEAIQLLLRSRSLCIISFSALRAWCDSVRRRPPADDVPVPAGFPGPATHTCSLGDASDNVVSISRLDIDLTNALLLGCLWP